MHTKISKDDRSRITVACERCRKLHNRCDGGKPVCSRCHRTGSQCVYVQGERKIMVSLRLYEQLKLENEKLKRDLARKAIVHSHNSLSYDIAPPANLLPSYNNSTSTPLSTGASSYNNVPRTNILPPLTNNALLPNSTVPSLSNMTTAPTVSGPLTNCNSLPDPLRKHDNFIIPLTQLLPTTRATVGNYLGSSSMTMFGLEIQGCLPATQTGASKAARPVNLDELNAHKDPVVPIILEKSRNRREIQMVQDCRNEPFVVQVDLPSYELAVACVDELQRYIDGCFYFFNPAQLKQRLAETYLRPKFGAVSFDTLLWYIELMIVLALGETYLRGTRQRQLQFKDELDAISKVNDGIPGMNFFRAAHCLIRIIFYDIQAYPSVLAVEVLLLCTFFFQIGDSVSGSYVFSGLTLRVAQLLGMHVDADMSTLDAYELEHRRRLWWSIYCLDRYIAVKAGFPICGLDHFYQTRLPTDIPLYGNNNTGNSITDSATSTTGAMSNGSLNNSGLGEFPSAVHINAFVEISKITRLIISELYHQPPGTTMDILPILSKIMSRLFAWRDEWPPQLGVDLRAESLACSRGAANIISEYFQCINLAVRPLLCHFVRKRVVERSSRRGPIDISSLSENLVMLLNASLFSSIQTIQCLSDQMNKDQYCVFAYLDREYVFSAASTLQLLYAAFGLCHLCCPALERALYILQKCEDMGNHKAKLRSNQLLNLITAVEFLHPDHEHTAQHFEQTAKQASDTVNNDEQVAPHTLAQQPLDTGVPCHNQVTTTDFLDIDRDIWSEISNEAFWLGNLSEEVSSWLTDTPQQP